MSPLVAPSQVPYRIGTVKVCPKCKRRYVNDGADVCPLDGGRLDDVGHPWIGSSIGQGYVIDQLVSESGLTSLFLARGAGQPVMVEALRTHLAKNSRMRTRFLRGVSKAAQLRHPSIVVTLATGEDPEGVPYVVTEMVEGIPLSRLIETGPLGTDKTLTIGLAMAQTLEYAHGRGVIHRNLKPANVFVSDGPRGPTTKLTGFGIASAIGDERMTGSGEVFGTPGYLAPEQAASSEVSPRTDLYALGVILFEMITGRPPFEGGSQSLMIKHLMDPPPSARKIVRTCPPALEALILHMMEKRPADRPGDAGIVRQVLETIR